MTPMRCLRLFFLFSALSASSASCRDASGQVNVVAYGGYEAHPSIIHEMIYHMMEDCTGLKGDFTRVHWHLAQTIAITSPEYPLGSMADGTWARDGGESHIVLTRDAWWNAETISHEVLHDLYKGDAPLDVSQRCILSWQRVPPT